MRTNLTLCTLALAHAACAQVVFELPTALPTLGTSVEQGWQWNGSPLDLPVTGVDVTWDLTGLLDASGSRTVEDAAPAGTPGAADFPNATHAYSEELNGATGWYYFRLGSGDSLWLEGVEYENGDLFNCASPNLYMFFPYAIDDFAESNTTCSFNGFPFPVNQGLVPVATGDLLYPGGTLTDMVMVRAVYGGTPAEYYWYQAGNALRWIGSYDPGAMLNLWASGSTGITSHLVHSATTYPLPADDAVHMTLATRSQRVNCMLLDHTGRLLFSGSLPVLGERIRVDVSALPAGQYILRVEDAEGTHIGPVSVMR